MLLVVVVGAGLLLAGAGSSVLVSGLAVLLVVVVGAGLLLAGAGSSVLVSGLAVLLFNSGSRCRLAAGRCRLPSAGIVRDGAYPTGGISHPHSGAFFHRFSGALLGSEGYVMRRLYICYC